MQKFIKVFEEWKMIRPTSMTSIRNVAASHVRFGTKVDTEIDKIEIKLTEESISLIDKFIKEKFPDERSKWKFYSESIFLANNDLPVELQDLKTKEIKFELDGLCKNKFGIYGRIKGFSSISSSVVICILLNQEKLEDYKVINNLNYSNINSINLSGYIKKYEK